ncbi:DUF2381 family protein [Archangium violaceum]|uniref:DUF2381 family protein n=1 Tax=Archangium violaceum TaxID=83451 RepID=UPI0036DC7945
MLPASSSFLLLVLLQIPTESLLPTVSCEDIERVELSLVSTTSVEVCISPGLMTGFRFDAPFSVDLQDDVRFEDVMRGRSGVSVVPPRDLAPGERLRLTAHLGGGASPQSITFALVAHRGRATRQVEVYRDKRTRESHQEEIEQLHEENRYLRAKLTQSGGLRGLFFSGDLGGTGISVQQLPLGQVEPHSDDALELTRVFTYRSKNSVAVEVTILNLGAEPWSAAEASLVSATGETLVGVRIGQVGPIPPGERRQVFIEADAAIGVPRGEVTLRLWSADARSISISKLTFP